MKFRRVLEAEFGQSIPIDVNEVVNDECWLEQARLSRESVDYL